MGLLMRYVLVVGAVALIAASLAWEFIPLQVMIWDGGYNLTVHVDSTAGRLEAVDCRAVTEAGAEELLANLFPPTTEFAGQPVIVGVQTSGRCSPCGRELARFQSSHLVVIGQLHDGRRFGKVVVIPDGRESSEVRVSLP
jgi:hypothetical protein